MDISNGLHSATSNLNHLGIEKAPSKSTIGYQNKNRDLEGCVIVANRIYKIDFFVKINHSILEVFEF